MIKINSLVGPLFCVYQLRKGWKLGMSREQLSGSAKLDLIRSMLSLARRRP